MRYTASTATVSWIDPVTGLPEVDAGHPGGMIPRAKILANAGYRFSNFLEAWLEVDTDANAIIGGNFTRDSGMYRGPSFLNTDSAPVGNIGRLITRTPQNVTFRQLVGCRTEAPEKIGRTVGGVFGQTFGGPLGGYIGDRLGQTAAEEAKVFPPIWTELELTINVDGTYTNKLVRCSLFPSMVYYMFGVNPPLVAVPGIYTMSYSYNAVPMLDTWYDRGWGPTVGGNSTGQPSGAPTAGNPWAMTKPTLTMASTLNDQPKGY